MSDAAKLSVVNPPPDDLGTDQASDLLLLDAWKSHRDSEALEQLVGRYSRLVMGVCVGQCRTREDAEDAFQATFMILARDADKIRDVGGLASWLHRVAYRTACRARDRKVNAQPLSEEPMQTSNPLESIAKHHQLRALDEELSGLPEKYRKAVVLHYYLGHSCQQTADTLGTSEGAIRGRLQRAKKELQRRLIRRGVAFSASVAVLSMVDSRPAVASDLISQTTSLAVDASGGVSTPVDFSPLLAKEPIMLSKLSLCSMVAAGAIGIAGLAYAQGGQNKGSNGSDPFGGGNAVVKMDPFSETPDSSGADPFGSDPFGGGAPAKIRVPASVAKTSAASPAANAAGRASVDNGLGWLSANANAITQIDAKLNDMTQMTYIELPLEEAVKTISEMHDLQVIIDRRAIEEIGLSPDQPVNIDVKDVTLESALNLMLRDLDLTVDVNNEVMLVTTIDVAEQNPTLRVYWGKSKGLEFDESAIKMIQQTIAPDSWENLGGPGTIGLVQASDNAAGIVVSNTYLVHRKLERFLKVLEAQGEGLKAIEKSQPAVSNPGGASGLGGGGSF